MTLVAIWIMCGVLIAAGLTHLPLISLACIEGVWLGAGRHHAWIRFVVCGMSYGIYVAGFSCFTLDQLSHQKEVLLLIVTVATLAWLLRAIVLVITVGRTNSLSFRLSDLFCTVFGVFVFLMLWSPVLTTVASMPLMRQIPMLSLDIILSGVVASLSIPLLLDNSEARRKYGRYAGIVFSVSVVALCASVAGGVWSDMFEVMGMSTLVAAVISLCVTTMCKLDALCILCGGALLSTIDRFGEDPVGQI